MKFKLPKPIVYEIEKKEYKRFIILNAALFVIGAIFLSIFVYKNYPYLADPKSSPYYNCGAPFGDGHPEFEFWGLYIPYVSFILILILNIFFCYANFYHNREALMYIALCNGIVFSIPFLHSLMELLLYPLAVICSMLFILPIIFFAIKRNKKGFLHSLMLWLSIFIWFKFIDFDIFLFLD